MADIGAWMEYPECPWCGAIQGEPDNAEADSYSHTCHSCGQAFQVEVAVKRYYRSISMRKGNNDGVSH